jgi:hypothetical protein
LPSLRAAGIKKFDIDIAPNFMYLLALLHPISTRGQADQKLSEKEDGMASHSAPGCF